MTTTRKLTLCALFAALIAIWDIHKDSDTVAAFDAADTFCSAVWAGAWPEAGSCERVRVCACWSDRPAGVYRLSDESYVRVYFGLCAWGMAGGIYC